MWIYVEFPCNMSGGAVDLVYLARGGVCALLAVQLSVDVIEQQARERVLSTRAGGLFGARLTLSRESVA